jgi:hypothetical protein
MNISKKEKASLLFQNVDSLLGGESSVELTQTSRGTNWKIKIYHPNPHQALQLADSIYKKCKSKYGDTVDESE